MSGRLSTRCWSFLIMFMMLTPTVSQGLDTQLPQSKADQKSKRRLDEAIVIRMEQGLTLRINQESIDREHLEKHLRAILRTVPIGEYSFKLTQSSHSATSLKSSI